MVKLLCQMQVPRKRMVCCLWASEIQARRMQVVKSPLAKIGENFQIEDL